MDFKKYLENLRNLDDFKKKIILWVIVGILALIMIAVWINSAAKKISGLADTAKNSNLPFLNLPNLSIVDTTSPSGNQTIK